VADISLVLVASAVLAAMLLATWRVVSGRPLWRWPRVAIAACAALLATSFAAWRISKAASFQLLGEPITRVETTSRVVALTFDDGPNPQYVDDILEVLRAEQVHATFFVVGRELARYPELGTKLVGAGHELGNHSYTHVRMLARSRDFIRGEIEQTDAEIRRSGYRGEIQFRPPNGKRLLALPWVLHEMGRRLTLWDVAPDSEDPAISPARLVERIHDEVRPGSIVLLHVMGLQGETSRAALPAIIHELKSRGYRFVTVSELVAIRDEHEDALLDAIGLRVHALHVGRSHH
jgi:peptidoglycan-N-acetylglucosamine deacetylase